MYENFSDAEVKILIKAIENARKTCDDEKPLGLSATRRVFGETEVEWFVEFDPAASWMTHLQDDFDPSSKSDEEIAEYIMKVWDKDWDDVQIDRPVGDYSLSSSDFKQSSEAAD